MKKLKKKYTLTLMVELEADNETGLQAALGLLKQKSVLGLDTTICDLKHGCYAVKTKAVGTPVPLQQKPRTR